MTELLTPDELAAKMKVSTQTLYKWRKARKMPYIKLPGNDIRYDAAKIESYLNIRTVKQKNPIPEQTTT